VYDHWLRCIIIWWCRNEVWCLMLWVVVVVMSSVYSGVVMWFWVFVDCMKVVDYVGL